MPCGRTDAITRRTRCSVTACACAVFRRCGSRQKEDRRSIHLCYCLRIASRRHHDDLVTLFCFRSATVTTTVRSSASSYYKRTCCVACFLLLKREYNIHSFCHSLLHIQPPPLQLLFNNLVEIIPTLKLRTYGAVEICIIIILGLIGKQPSKHTDIK